MKKALFTVTFTTVLFVFISAFAHNKVVVVPLRSSESHALAQLTFSASGSNTIISDSITLKLKSEGSTTETIFTLVANLSSVGQTYKFDQINSVSFNAAGVLLTNGIDDGLGFWRSLSGGTPGSASSTSYESYFIKGGITGEYDPDFSGSRITHVLVHVDNLLLITLGPTTSYDVTIRVVIMGHP